MDIGDRIRKTRGSRSRLEYAEALGIHPQTLYLYEKGKRVVDVELLQQICQESGIAAEWLIYGDQKEKDQQGDNRRLEKKLAEKESLLATREARINQLQNDLIAAQAGALKAYELAVGAIQPLEALKETSDPMPLNRARYLIQEEDSG
jgi:transcriptional regulator with XRE-family HTH domain